MNEPSHDRVQVITGKNPKQAVIWLHGLGADGYDFVPLVRELEHLGLDSTHFVFPHAPKIPVSINGGYVMPAWYDIKYAELGREEDEQGVRESQKVVETLIKELIAQGFESRKIVLAGFSQGGAITYQAGLRTSHKLAGIIALSTYITCENTLDAERSSVNAQTPILACHGSSDPVVPVTRGEHAANLLKSKGYAVQWQTYPMEHSVCGEEVQLIGQFLNKVFSE